MARGVAVTGLGVIVGSLWGKGRLADALRASTMACSGGDRAAGDHLPQSARRAVLTTCLDLSSWVPPAAGRPMSPPSKLGGAAAGRADRALVGGVEEMPPLLHALLDRFLALARPGITEGEAARPFDRRRDGFMAAEGAVVLVLEAEDGARARGARVYARIRGAGGAFDPSAPRVGWGRGHEGLAQGLRALLDRLRLAPRDVPRIASGASGSVGRERP